MVAVKTETDIAGLHGKPTVCMMSNLYPPTMSGSSNQLQELSRQLVERGHKVIVVTAKLDKKLPDFEVSQGVRVYRLPAIRVPEMGISLNFPWINWVTWPKNVRRIMRIIKDEDVALVHVHNHMFDLALIGAYLRKKLALPTIVSVHTPITHNNWFYNRLLVTAERLILRPYVIGRADVLLGADNNIMKYTTRRFDRTDTVIIPYGIHLAEDPPSELIHELKDKFGLSGKRVILSVGHLHEIRNRLDLISAMPGILAEFNNAVLVIVGAVSDPRAARLAEQLGISDKVIFTGVQSHGSVAAFLKLAECEAHWFTTDRPAVDSSPGIATFEAMLLGVTALTVANADAYEPGVIADGETLILVKPGDVAGISAKIVGLLRDPELARQIGRSARQVAIANFSWPSVAGKISLLYQKLCR